jgi:hypothetical protein
MITVRFSWDSVLSRCFTKNCGYPAHGRCNDAFKPTHRLNIMYQGRLCTFLVFVLLVDIAGEHGSRPDGRVSDARPLGARDQH